MSLQTTLARAEARHQQTQWKLHLQGCPRCYRAMRGRAWADLCKFGTPIRNDKIAAERELAHRRELDKLPSPDQETLFW